MADVHAPAWTGHRFFDIGTKLAGLGLLVAALEVGIASATGLTLATAGVAVGVCTVFIGSERT